MVLVRSTRMEQWEYVAVAIAWERRVREYVARGIDEMRAAASRCAGRLPPE